MGNVIELGKHKGKKEIPTVQSKLIIIATSNGLIVGEVKIDEVGNAIMKEMLNPRLLTLQEDKDKVPQVMLYYLIGFPPKINIGLIAYDYDPPAEIAKAYITSFEEIKREH